MGRVMGERKAQSLQSLAGECDASRLITSVEIRSAVHLFNLDIRGVLDTDGKTACCGAQITTRHTSDMGPGAAATGRFIIICSWYGCG